MPHLDGLPDPSTPDDLWIVPAWLIQKLLHEHISRHELCVIVGESMVDGIIVLQVIIDMEIILLYKSAP